MNKVSLKGVIVGSLACGLSAAIVATVMLLIFNAVHTSAHVVFVFLMLANVLASILGGYVSARLANHDELLNGALAVALPVVGELARIAHHDWRPVSFALLLIYPIGGLFGGSLRLVQKRGGPSEAATLLR